MAGTYKLLELVGTSPISFAEATKAAIAEASKSVRHMDWFEVVQERGSIADGQVHEFQVTLKLALRSNASENTVILRECRALAGNSERTARLFYSPLGLAHGRASPLPTRPDKRSSQGLLAIVRTNAARR
jgi:flavin-binding protein dodecin